MCHMRVKTGVTGMETGDVLTFLQAEYAAANGNAKKESLMAKIATEKNLGILVQMMSEHMTEQNSEEVKRPIHQHKW
jgi:hypothetical protein